MEPTSGQAITQSGVGYMLSTLDSLQEGHIAHSDAHQFQIVAYSDADAASCLDTQRSTTGGHLCVEGRSSRSPIHSLSNIQASTASSTPETEMVAAETVLRQLLVPSLDIWDILLQNGVQ